jgi:hypothetical protein
VVAAAVVSFVLHPEHTKTSFLDLASRPTAFLAGTGRSGTTWLEEIINWRHDYRVVFEPFYPARVPFCSGFPETTYLSAAESALDHYRVARTVLSGRFRNSWTDQFNHQRIYWKRLIKDVRANLFLHWLHRCFPALPMVFLLRHPCAVVVSQQKALWRPSAVEFLEKPALVRDYLEPFVEVIRSAEDDFDQKVIAWCVKNFVPLQQFRRGEMLVMFYEDLLTQPETAIRRLFDFLKQRFTPESLTQLKRPSALVRADSAIVTGNDPLSSWRQHLTDKQVERAVSRLREFGLDRIYGAESSPRIRPDEVLADHRYA